MPLKNPLKALGCCLLASFLITASVAPAFCATPARPTKAAEVQAPLTKPVEDGNFIRFKHITINKKTREISISVKTAIARGILEYFLVGEKGKAYESAFKVEDALPSELNFALILIGCEALPYDTFMKLLQAEKSRDDLIKDHPASIISIDIRKKGKSVPFSSVIRDREGKKEPLTWIYTGGRFDRQTPYSADQPLSFIGVWPDVSAVINLFSGRNNPYRGEFGFEMNTKAKGLAKDQDYELVIRRYSR